jgi:tetratricopeptide (TPR) repeat protein
MRIWIIGIALVCVVVAAGGFEWWRTGRPARIVAEALPPLPDLSNVVPALRERIAATDARARRRVTAQKGLAELARLYHANGFLDEAMRCYAGLERLEPSNPRWFHYHATILGGYGEIDRAVELWRQVITLAPDYIPPRLRLGDCFLKSDRIDDAIAAYEAVLKISPDNPYAWLNLGRIDMEAKRWDQARAKLEKVVRDTKFTLGYDLIVHLYEQMGLHALATGIRGASKASGAYLDPPDAWLDELMDVCYDPYRLGLVAGFAAHTGQIPTALRLIRRAMDLAPTDVTLHFQMGGIAVSQRDLNGAEEEFKSCTLLDPNFSDGWAQLSDIQEQQGKRADAERTLALGLEHCPNSPGLHLMRARHLRDAGRSGEAIAEYQASIRFRPNEPDAYTDLGSLYINLGYTDAGIQEMQKALEADPGDPMALGIMTYHAISTNNEPEARQWLNREVIQPRVPREQTSRLIEAYRQAFGRDWIPDKSSE